MTFKVGDKVRCIDDRNDADTTIGNIYTLIDINTDFIYKIKIIDDVGVEQWCSDKNFELVQEDKLPHELLGLDRYRVVKKDESDPLWELFLKRFNNHFEGGYADIFLYYGYDGSDLMSDDGSCATDLYDEFENNPTLITLAERDRCVNKKESQTKQLSKPIRSCEYNGSIYKEDTIDGVSIEDMKATRDDINSKLQTHRNLFLNPNKGHYKSK